MFLTISLFLLFLSQLVIGEESDNFCKTEATKYSAFNFGLYLIIQTQKGNDSKLWAGMPLDNNNLFQVQDGDFKQEVFGDLTLNELGVVITFNFGDDVCNGSDKYCEVVMRAQNLILIQLRDSSKGEIFKNAFPFTFLRKEADYTIPLNESEMPWNWPLKGEDISKVGIFPAIAQGWQYYGGVFSTEHNAMILITQNTLNDKEFKGVINKLDTTTGQWQQWEHFGSIGFQGLFVLDYKLYGITPFGNSIVEFKPDLTFTERAPIKNFFNCTEQSVTTTHRTETVGSIGNGSSTPIAAPIDETKTSDSSDLKPESDVSSDSLPIETNSKEPEKEEIPTNNSDSDDLTSQPDTAELSDNKSSPWIWIILFIVALIVVALILMFVFWLNSGKQPPNPESPERPTD